MRFTELPRSILRGKIIKYLSDSFRELFARANRASPGSRVAVIATSLGQQGITANSTTLATNTRSWLDWAKFFSNGAFESPVWHDTTVYEGWEPSGVQGTSRNFRGLNAGVSGQTSAQIFARRSFLVDRVECDIIILDCGTNDMGNTAKEVIQQYRESLANYYLQNGKKVVLLPILSRALSSWPSNQDQRKKAAWINSKTRDFCVKTRDCYFFDWNASWVDTANADGEPRPWHSADGIHFNPTGAVAVGERLAEFLKVTFGLSAQSLVWSQDDKYDATNNPRGNLLPNPLLFGTAGTKPADGSTTGDVADGMRMERNSGNATVACSKEVRPLNRGFWQVFTFTTAAVPTASLFYFRTSTANFTHALGSKWVRASAEIEISSSPLIQGVTMYLEDNNGTGKISVQSLAPYTAGSNDLTPGVIQPLPAQVYKGLLKTPAMRLPADSTILRWRVEVRLAAATTTTTAAYNTSATVINVTSSLHFVPGKVFVPQGSTEKILINDVIGNNLYVTRAHAGTTAASITHGQVINLDVETVTVKVGAVELREVESPHVLTAYAGG